MPKNRLEGRKNAFVKGWQVAEVILNWLAGRKIAQLKGWQVAEVPKNGWHVGKMRL